MDKVSVEAMELSFKVLETILVYKDYTSKEEVLKVAETMKNIALENSKYPKTVKEAYIEACSKLSDLPFDDMMEIKEIITSDDED